MGETKLTTATDTMAPSGPNTPNDRKELLSLTQKEWVWAVAFMLSMSMLGLKFPLGYLAAPLIMLARFRSNRYDFLMMFTIFMGGYGVATYNSLGIGTQNITLFVGVIGFLCLKKYPLLNKSMLLWALYGGALILLASYSIVSFRVQFPRITRYLSVIYFI